MAKSCTANAHLWLFREFLSPLWSELMISQYLVGFWNFVHLKLAHILKILILGKVCQQIVLLSLGFPEWRGSGRDGSGRSFLSLPKNIEFNSVEFCVNSCNLSGNSFNRSLDVQVVSCSSGHDFAMFSSESSADLAMVMSLRNQERRQVSNCRTCKYNHAIVDKVRSLNQFPLFVFQARSSNSVKPVGPLPQRWFPLTICCRSSSRWTVSRS